MKLSEVDEKRLNELTDAERTEIAFGGWTEDTEKGAAALLLGGPLEEMPSRAEAAAELYRAGRAPLIIPTGGVARDTELGRQSEAKYLTELLLSEGVPAGDILTEEEAQTTRENMIFGETLLERRLRPRGPFRVYIVTTEYHMRRSLALARLYLPRTAVVAACPAVLPSGSRNEWVRGPYWRHAVETEVRLLKGMVDRGEAEDILF